MIIDQSKITIPKGVALGTAIQNRLSLFSSKEVNRLHQIDPAGVVTNIAYPDYISYVNYQFDCEATTTLLTCAGWKTATVTGGTVALATTGIPPGTPTATQAVDLANHPGVISFSSSATNGSGAHIFFGNTNGKFNLAVGAKFDCVAFLPAVTGLTLRVGFHDSISATNPNNGMYFDMDGTGAVTFRVRVANAATFTSAIPGILVANTWYHFSINVSGTNTVNAMIFAMNGALLASRTTPVTVTLPLSDTQDTLPRFMCLSATTTARLLAQVDFIRFAMPVTRGSLS